jgi:hypothetical protein
MHRTWPMASAGKKMLKIRESFRRHESIRRVMGLFSKKVQVRPRARRQDVSALISRAPDREVKWLTWAQPELDYLNDSLPAEENVLGIASCSETAGPITCGIIMLTPTRLISVTGSRDRGGAHGRPSGAPTVRNFDFKRLHNFSYGPKGVRGVRGYYATFSMLGQGDVIMDIGQDDGWVDAFLNHAMLQLNRSKLS